MWIRGCFVRRAQAVENAWATKDAQLIFAALDWAKSFDNIAPEGLLDALRQFGIPQQMIAIIDYIYGNKKFTVSNLGSVFDVRNQLAGISQGCPLSPFLFIILMTIIMGDAKRKLSQQSCQLADQIPVHDLLYADDTLLIDVYGHNIQKYMDAVIEIGGQYGLLINWKKVGILAIKCETAIYDNEGNDVDNKQSINYLKFLLHKNAKKC